MLFVFLNKTYRNLRLYFAHVSMCRMPQGKRNRNTILNLNLNVENTNTCRANNRQNFVCIRFVAQQFGFSVVELSMKFETFI